MPDMGALAHEYMELHRATEHFAVVAVSETDPAALTEAQIKLAELTVDKAFYEDLPETRQQLEAVVTYVPEVNPLIEAQRNRLLQLLNDPQHRLGSLKLSEEVILKRIEMLPEAPSGFETGDVELASQLLASVFKRQEERLDDRVSEPPAEVESGAEIIKEPLTVTFYPDLVLGFSDNSFVPLRRRLELSVSTLDAEAKIADYRFKAFQVIVAAQGSPLKPQQIWKQAKLPPEEYSSALWASAVDPFLTEELICQGQPMIHSTKSDGALSKSYQLVEDFKDIKFEQAEGSSGFIDRDYFILDVGDREFLTGRNSRTMHLLLNTTEEDLLTRDVFDRNGVVPAEELAKTKQPERALPVTIGGLRRVLGAVGADSRYLIHSKTLKGRGAERSGYWCEVLLLPEEEAMVKKVAQLIIDQAKTLKEIGVAEELVDDDRLNDLMDQYEDDDKTPVNIRHQILALKEAANVKFKETLLEVLTKSNPALEVIGKVLSDLMANEGAKLNAFLKVITPPKINSSAESSKPSIDSTGAAGLRLGWHLEDGDDTERFLPGGMRKEMSEIVNPVLEDLLPRMHEAGLLTRHKFAKSELDPVAFVPHDPKDPDIAVNRAIILLIRRNADYLKYVRSHPDWQQSFARWLGRHVKDARATWLSERGIQLTEAETPSRKPNGNGRRRHGRSKR